MAGAGQAVQQSLGTIDPSSLIGQSDTSIVEPRATAALIDAFRQGVISSDDIVNRIGQLGQSKKKAEIDIAGAQSMQAQEAMSPEAQAVRAQQLATQQAEGEQAQRTSEAAMLKQDTLEKYPGVAYYDKLAVEAGIHSPPKLPDGTPDYAEMENIGLELALQKSSQIKALKELSTIETKEDDKARVISSRYKDGGKPVDSNYVEKLRVTATKPLERMAPGSFSAAPPSVSVEARTEVAPQGTGWPMAPLPPEVAKPVVMASEQQRSLAQSALTNEQLKAIGDSFTALQKDSPWLTGPVMGRLGTLVKAENWDRSRANFQRATTSMLANLAKGIYHETGVLSDKDVERYQKALPGVNDSSDVAQVKLSGVSRDIFNSIDTNIETLKGQGQVITPIIQAMQDSARAELQKLGNNAAAAPAAVTTSGGPPVRVNSAAEAAALPATVQFFLTPDGRQKKNPNYRP